MSENATSDPGQLTEDFDKIHDAGGVFKSSENEKHEGLIARETETNDVNTGEIISGCTAAENVVDSEVSVNQSEVDAQFQPRAEKVSFVSDSTESSFVTEEVKYDCLPAENLNIDTAAGRSEEQEIPATETDPFIQSVKYLEKHQILRLFQNFAAQIVYKRPENPLQYLVEELERRRGETINGSTETQDSGLLS